MDLGDVRSLSAQELAEALDQLGIEAGWRFGDLIRDAASVRPTQVVLPDPEGGRSQAFQNLIVGTIAERIFLEEHLRPLTSEGFVVVDYHEQGENRDYGLQREGTELPINVKTASTIFRKARETVGLDPEDCIPISAYKAIGASERVPTLVYVDLVDFTLRERVDAFMESLDSDLAIGWHLLSWYVGPGARKSQDQYLRSLFDRRGTELKRLGPDSSQFRVISARKVLAVMRREPRRVPGLGIRAAGTGAFNAEVNVHISVAEETRSWDDVANACRSHGIQYVVDQVLRTATFSLPDPDL